MTKDEICSLNLKAFELKQKLITVQDQVTRYIQLSAVSQFFKRIFQNPL